MTDMAERTDRREPSVLGSGLLAETIRAGRPAGGVTVVASDAWHTADGMRAGGMRADDADGPWLPVRTELGRVVIGPLEIPGAAGCASCAETRRRLAKQDADAERAVLDAHADALTTRPSTLLTVLAADVVAALVHDELARAAADVETAWTRCALLYLDLRELTVSTHRFLPDPLCVRCGDLPDDAAELAGITLRRRPKRAPDVYRIRDIGEELESLQDTYVDGETGLIRRVYRDDVGGLAVAAAPIGLRDGGAESGYGRTRSYRTSSLTAILEALERYGGMRPGGKRTVVSASYHELADRAIDPRTLGTHPESCYASPGFRFPRFDPDAPGRWVWGYSFARAEPVLVPEFCGYYRTPQSETGPRPYLYEISNGCALGGCLEEAILFGIMEVAERDAFLLTWYGRLPAPRIDPRSATTGTIPMLVDRMRAELGYDVQLFDITVEQGVPSVWALAVHPGGDENRPKALCAAGSHPDPERAAENALSELGPILTDLVQRYPGSRDRAKAMLLDPAEVRAMSDHALLSGNPEAFDRLDFLTGREPGRTFPGMRGATGLRHDDLSDDLRELIRRYTGTGLDVVVVDQTTPEHRVGNLACVKVLIPGALPMTFGHEFRRTEGLPRLLEMPRLLGYRTRAMTPGDVNPHPHPFP